MEPRFEAISSESVADRRAPGPRVSVVVPCRNECAHIEACLRSVLAQTLPADRFEILVVDGLSDDGTRAVLEGLERSAPNLRVLDNPARITPVAMNIGIRAAAGEFVAILGAHTIYPPDYLAICLDLMQCHPEADCVGGSIAHEGQTPFGRAVALAMSHPLGMGNALHRNPDHEGYAEGACFPLFRRAVFDRIGLYEESLVRNQDDELNDRLTQSGGKVWLSPRARAAYRVRESPSALFRQFFQYGYWRTAALRRRRFKTSPRRFVPATMLVVFCATVALALWRGGAWIVASVSLLAVYLAALLFVGWANAGARDPGVALRFPVAAAIMHLAYALGFFWSLGASPRRAAPADRGTTS